MHSESMSGISWWVSASRNVAWSHTTMSVYILEVFMYHFKCSGFWWFIVWHT